MIISKKEVTLVMYSTQIVSFASRQPNLIPFVAIERNLTHSGELDIEIIICNFRPSNIES